MPRKRVATRQFKVVFEPDGSGWHVYLPDVPGCRTRGRSIADGRRNIREALAACEDVVPNAAAIARSAEFIEHVCVPYEARKAVNRALQAREELAKREAEATTAAARGARALRRAGLSLRDAGELLHLSHQRIKQLTDG
jgi:predicted RNase H-like HicB family nuclease